MTVALIVDYQVVLDTFRGPLDLLLYLVKRDEIDILDIPIATLAEQFKHYLDVLALIDVERAGDFRLKTSGRWLGSKTRRLESTDDQSFGYGRIYCIAQGCGSKSSK